MATQTHKAPPGFEDQDYDFAEETVPQHVYMIASPPRSGGTLLSRHLWASGIMGAPAEYFGFYSTFMRLVVRLKPDTYEEYVSLLLPRRTTANAVFGFKAHYDHVQFMQISGILHRFRQMRVIAIERRDHLAQAISQARALQTGQWNSWNKTPRVAPVYDPNLIRWCIRHLDDQRSGWQGLFERQNVTPIKVDYDALAADPEGVTQDVIARAELPKSPVTPVSLPELERQADTINAEWLDRFKQETDGA